MTGVDGKIDAPFHLGGAEGKGPASPQLEFPIGMGRMDIYALHTGSLQLLGQSFQALIHRVTNSEKVQESGDRHGVFDLFGQSH